MSALSAISAKSAITAVLVYVCACISEKSAMSVVSVWDSTKDL